MKVVASGSSQAPVPAAPLSCLCTCWECHQQGGALWLTYMQWVAESADGCVDSNCFTQIANPAWQMGVVTLPACYDAQ